MFKQKKDVYEKDKYRYIYIYTVYIITITVYFSTSQTKAWTNSNLSLYTLFFLTHFKKPPKNTIISFPVPIQPLVCLSHRFPCDQDYLSEDILIRSVTCSHLDTQAIPIHKTMLALCCLMLKSLMTYKKLSKLKKFVTLSAIPQTCHDLFILILDIHVSKVRTLRSTHQPALAGSKKRRRRAKGRW